MDNIPNLDHQKSQVNSDIPIAGSILSGDQTSSNQSPLIANNSPINKSSRIKKMLVAFLGLIILTGGIGTGIFLTQRSQNIREKAAPGTSQDTSTSGDIVLACNKIDIYKVRGDEDNPSNWSKLTSTEISSLREGDTIYFVVDGTEISGYGSIDKAIFIVNNQEYEGTHRNTGINCLARVGESCLVSFYLKYTIPKGIISFNVGAKLHHSQEDKWF